jgi:hypothetical protein
MGPSVNMKFIYASFIPYKHSLKVICTIYLFVYVFIGGTSFLNSELIKQVLYHLSHQSRPPVYFDLDEIYSD